MCVGAPRMNCTCSRSFHTEIKRLTKWVFPVPAGPVISAPPFSMTLFIPSSIPFIPSIIPFIPSFIRVHSLAAGGSLSCVLFFCPLQGTLLPGSTVT